LGIWGDEKGKRSRINFIKQKLKKQIKRIKKLFGLRKLSKMFLRSFTGFKDALKAG